MRHTFVNFTVSHAGAGGCATVDQSREALRGGPQTQSFCGTYFFLKGLRMRRFAIVSIAAMFVMLGTVMTAEAGFYRRSRARCAPACCAPTCCEPAACEPVACCEQVCCVKRCGHKRRARRCCKPQCCAPTTCCAPTACCEPAGTIIEGGNGAAEPLPAPTI